MSHLPIVYSYRLVRVVLLCCLMSGMVACAQSPSPTLGDGTGTLADERQSAGRPSLLPTPTAMLPAAAYTEEDRVIMEAIRQNLAQPDLSAERRRMLDDKLRFFEREVAERATAIAEPPVDPQEPEPTDALVSTPFAPLMTVVSNAGTIIDDGEYPGQGHRTQNSWYIDQADQRVLVYAGAGTFKEEVPDPQEGSLIVVVRQGPEPDGQDKPVLSTKLYMTPTPVGAIRIVGVDVTAEAMRLTLRAMDGTVFVFNVTARRWEVGPGAPPPTSTPEDPTPTASVGCELYPIAVDAAVIRDVAVGDVIPSVAVGAGPGNFGWLTWTGDQSIMALTEALTPPGTSEHYRNPHDGGDRRISVNEWVHGRPGVGESRDVRDALSALRNKTITVPLWDAVTGEGSRLQYHVVGFAQIQLTNDQLAGKNLLSFRYVGDVTCQ